MPSLYSINVLKLLHDRKDGHKWSLPICATMLSAVGGLLFGYDTGVISGAMIQLRHQFALSHLYQEIIISVTLFAAAVAAMCSAGLSDWLGRKPVVLIASAIFTVGAILLGVSENKETLVFGRLVVGLGIGVASMTVPIYIAEIAPGHLRGPLVTLNTVCITAGQCLAGIVDGLFIVDSANGWRYMLALGGVPSLIQFFGFLAMPESPRWLVEKGRIAEAREVLRRIHGEHEVTPDIEKELHRIVEASRVASQTSPRMYGYADFGTNTLTRRPLEDNQTTDSISSGKICTNSVDCTSENPFLQVFAGRLHFQGFKNRCSNLTIFRVLRYMPTRRAFFISCGLQVFQQLVGINTVMYYSASIISMAGIGSHLKWENRDKIIVWMSAVVAFANFAFCFSSPFLIARFRRRTLLLCSLTGVFFSLVFLGISFQLIASYSSPVTISEAFPIKFADHMSEIDCSRAKTCDECMRTTGCGYCYSLEEHSFTKAVNGSCALSAGVYATHSAYGRCSNATITEYSKFMWAYDHCPTRLGWLTLICLLLYLASFAPGMAPLPWTIISEMFPTWARSTGMAGGATSNWLANIFVSLTFLTLTEHLTRQGTYFLYAGFTVLALAFVYNCVPETGTGALEDLLLDDAQQPEVVVG